MDTAAAFQPPYHPQLGESSELHDLRAALEEELQQRWYWNAKREHAQMLVTHHERRIAMLREKIEATLRAAGAVPIQPRSKAQKKRYLAVTSAVAERALRLDWSATVSRDSSHTVHQAEESRANTKATTAMIEMMPTEIKSI